MIDMSGKKFGRLTVLKWLYKKKNNYYWLCKCDCGKETIVSRSHLVTAHTESCGCLQRERAKDFHVVHNMSGSRIYHIWSGIKDRCLNKNKENYKYYGGRGIKICDEWLADFMNFYNWAITNGYKETLTIERINNDGNYEPTNCRWATKREQSNNTRRNIYVTYRGKTQSLANWCRELKIDYKIIRSKIRSCTPEQAFETKIGATV